MSNPHDGQNCNDFAMAAENWVDDDDKDTPLPFLPVQAIIHGSNSMIVNSRIQLGSRVPWRATTHVENAITISPPVETTNEAAIIAAQLRRRRLGGLIDSISI